MIHIPGNVALEPYAALAVAVIRLALHDARLRGSRGEAARRFLAGSDGLSFWCDVASIPPEVVARKAHDVLSAMACGTRSRAA